MGLLRIKLGSPGRVEHILSCWTILQSLLVFLWSMHFSSPYIVFLWGMHFSSPLHFFLRACISPASTLSSSGACISPAPYISSCGACISPAFYTVFFRGKENAILCVLWKPRINASRHFIFNSFLWGLLPFLHPQSSGRWRFWLNSTLKKPL